MHAYNYQITVFLMIFCIFFNEIYILLLFQSIEISCC